MRHVVHVRTTDIEYVDGNENIQGHEVGEYIKWIWWLAVKAITLYKERPEEVIGDLNCMEGSCHLRTLLSTFWTSSDNLDLGYYTSLKFLF